jgi:hypothetical protein
MTEAQQRDHPGDYESQVGQGPVTAHSEEHLVSSDQGIAMLRRLLRRQVRAVAEGHDPIGVSFDPNAPPVVFEACNQIQMNTPPIPPAG